MLHDPEGHLVSFRHLSLAIGPRGDDTRDRSAVLQACAQPKSCLQLRWALALLCVGLSTIGRAAANIILVFNSMHDPASSLLLERGILALTLYFVGLEALPSVIVIGALGEQV